MGKQLNLELDTVRRSYREPLAVAASALTAGFELIFGEQPPCVEVHGKVATVAIRGPLEHHVIPWGDSYDGVKARVAEALATQAETILLSIDSPGGLVSGAFDCSTELRAMVAAAGKRLVAYVDGTTCSAAYALACAADEIVIPPAGVTGSVGVIAVVATHERAAEAAGVSLHVIRSGARKADGIADEALSDAGAAALQSTVDAQARVFFDLVAASRGLSADDVEAWEGRVFCGSEAIAAGLADVLETEDQLVARLNGEAPTQSTAPQGQEGSAVDLEEMKKALRARAEGEGEDAKRAKKALAALEGEEEAKSEEPDGDEPKAKDDEHEEPDGDEKPEDKGAKALAMVQDLKRDQIIASRPDLSAEQRKALASVPVESLKSVLAAIPRITSPVASAQAALGAKPTQAAHEGSGNTEADALISAALGQSNTPVTRQCGNTLTMRACTPDEARKHLAILEASR